MQKFLEKGILFIWNKMPIFAFLRAGKEDKNVKVQLLNFVKWNLFNLQ
jgi:hypothetical protein